VFCLSCRSGSIPSPGSFQNQSRQCEDEHNAFGDEEPGAVRCWTIDNSADDPHHNCCGDHCRYQAHSNCRRSSENVVFWT
jgi:hypothetical protein